MPHSAFGWDLINFDRLKRPSTAFAASVYIFVFLILVVILALVGASLWRLVVGVGDYNSEKGADAARNLLLSIGAILAAPFIAWRTWISHLQWKNSIEQLAIQGETLNTSLLTKSIDMLGAMRDENVIISDDDRREKYQIVKRKNIELRIGGILILKRIAINSLDESQYIIDILREYLASNSAKMRLEVERELEKEENEQYIFESEYFQKSGADVEICVKAILEISRTVGKYMKISLGKSAISSIDLSGISVENVDLSDCYLIGLNLSKSEFLNCKIDFGKMIDCQLFGTDLSKSFLMSWSRKRYYLIDDGTKIPNGYDFNFEEDIIDPGFEAEVRRYFAKK